MKKRTVLFILPCLFSFITLSAQTDISLFNGTDLSGWDTYIGPLYDTTSNTWGTSPRGLNYDPLHVFSVVKDGDLPAIRISGEEFGGISTIQDFENYHLTFEFRWGKKKSAPRKQGKMDSGVLYHAIGQHGADFGFWMRSQEFQIQEGDCGDYWGVAGGSFDIEARGKKKDEYVYRKGAPKSAFNELATQGRHCIKNPDNEKPAGEYNSVEIYCLGGTAVHIMNGKVVMVLYNSSYIEIGKQMPLVKGKIQIQSEGAEIFYRNIKVSEINNIPKELIGGN
jgi:hypothetical protein